VKKKRYSTEQIVTALKQVDMGMPVSDLIRQQNRPS
jgi:putative transposase